MLPPVIVNDETEVDVKFAVIEPPLLGIITTVGVVVYPVPADVIEYEVITPAVNVTVAVAPLPVVPIKAIVGVVV